MTNEQEQVVEPTFRTRRLRVWRVYGIPAPQNMPRAMYIACLDDGRTDWPGVVLSCSTLDLLENGLYVDWIEVAGPSRRKGLAMEFLQKLREMHGRHLEVYGVSEEGKRLEHAFKAWQDGIVAKKKRKAASKATA